MSYSNSGQNSIFVSFVPSAFSVATMSLAKRPAASSTGSGAVVFILARKGNQRGIDSRRSHPIDLNKRAGHDCAVIVAAASP